MKLSTLRRPHRRIGLIVLVCLLVGCAILFVSKNLGARYALFQHRQLWSNHAITHYRYRVEVSCLCPPEITTPFIVEVRGNTPISIKYVDTGVDVTNKDLEHYKSVEALFQVIQDAIAGRYDRVSVEYDEVIGYPKEIQIDRVFFGRDDEISHTISEFEALK